LNIGCTTAIANRHAKADNDSLPTQVERLLNKIVVTPPLPFVRPRHYWRRAGDAAVELDPTDISSPSNCMEE